MKKKAKKKAVRKPTDTSVVARGLLDALIERADPKASKRDAKRAK